VDIDPSRGGYVGTAPVLGALGFLVKIIRCAALADATRQRFDYAIRAKAPVDLDVRATSLVQSCALADGASPLRGCATLSAFPNRGHIAGESHEPKCAE
jgi:hypothetical protein